MAADIGGSSKAIWLPQSNAIVTLVFMTPLAQLADLWGRRLPLLLASSAACIGSVIVSRSTTMGMALAGNVIASCSFASAPLLFAVASEIVPRRYRPISQAGINGMFSLTGVVVLLAGTYLCQNYLHGWRILWYVCAGVSALATLLTFLFYNPPPRVLQASLTLKQKVKRVDWVGVLTLPVGLTLFVMALTWSENPFPWSDEHILGPFIVGSIVLMFVIYYEWKVKTDGLFHRQLFKKSRNFPLALFAISVEGASFFAVNAFFPTEIGSLFELDPMDVGIRFSIAFVSSTVAALLVAWYSSRWKAIRVPLLLGFTCFIVAFSMSVVLYAQSVNLHNNTNEDIGLLMSINVGSSAVIWVASATIGFGLGSVVTPLTTAAQFSAPPELITISTGALLCLRTFGAGIILPVINSVFNSQMKKNVPANIAERVLPLGLGPEQLGDFITALNAHNQTLIAAIPGVTPQIIEAGIQGLKAALVSSFRMLWITPLVISAIALFGSSISMSPVG
jgi:MFS family permease